MRAGRMDITDMPTKVRKYAEDNIKVERNSYNENVFVDINGNRYHKWFGAVTSNMYIIMEEDALEIIPDVPAGFEFQLYKDAEGLFHHSKYDAEERNRELLSFDEKPVAIIFKDSINYTKWR